MSCRTDVLGIACKSKATCSPQGEIKSLCPTPKSTRGMHHWGFLIINPHLMSCLLSVPLLHFTVEADLATFILQVGELGCVEGRWPLQGHLLGGGRIWTRSRSLCPTRAFFCWRCSLGAAKGFVPSLPTSLWTAKVYSLHLEASCSSEAFWLQSKVAGGQRWMQAAYIKCCDVIPWQHMGRVHGACFPSANR